MTRNLHPKLAVLFMGAALAVPATAPGATTSLAAQTGGTLAPDETPQPPAGARSELTLRTETSAMLGRRVQLRGSVARAPAGRQVSLQRLESSGRWTSVATASTARDGTFSARWRADRSGRVTFRAILAVTGRARTTNAEAATARVTIYEPAVATWYGPGLYGNRTACGQVLTPQLVGVAHRTLPCGTNVEIYYGGRKVMAPVVDRGPYAAGASWDLTSAAAGALRLTHTAGVGTIQLHRPAR